MKKNDFKPPSHLSEKSQKLWREVVPVRAKSPGRLALLETALEAKDRADQAKQTVNAEGLTTKTKTTGAIHVHPLVKVERESRQLFVKCWTTLGLYWHEKIDGMGWEDWQIKDVE